MLVGIIADTHGRLPASVHGAFAGVGHIIHAGDIGPAELLYELQSIAPVTAVLGNNDFDIPGWPLDPYASVTLGGVRFLVGHIERQLRREHDLAAEGVDAVVTGHSHVPRIELVDGVLHINPGSPTRSRGSGHTVAVAEVGAGTVKAGIVRL